jgi:glycosyltransferase involved in cell wall biosynthesis
MFIAPEEVRQEVESLYQEVESLYQEVEGYKREVEGYKREVEAYKREVEAYKQEVEVRSQAVRTLSKELEAYKQEVEIRSQELEVRNQEVMALRQEVLRLRNPVYWIKRRFHEIFGPSDDIFEKPRRDGTLVGTPQVEHPQVEPPRAGTRFSWASSLEMCLAQIFQEWQPDIIHTLGLEPASFLYLDVRNRLERIKNCKWIVQARGGPDLALHRLLPQYSERIGNVLTQCDQFIADNNQNYGYALEMGLAKHKITPLGVVPGTGGIDIDRLAQAWGAEPSQRQRIVLWPRAYECPQSKALQVFEAIRIAWEQIQPCEFYMTAAIQDEIYMWHQTLPEEIRHHCHLMERIPRDELLGLMLKSRVLLAPSLSDGIPNTLYEAMASGAFPILSPLETVTSVVKSGLNVLFARNLYPEEIAEALCRSMSDDALVDGAAQRNLQLVRKLADRATIGPRVVANYEKLSGISR